MHAKQIGTLLLAAGRRFFAEDCTLFGAALAYYAIFSLAPVLVIVMAVAGLVYGAEATQGYVFSELTGLVGADSAALIQRAVEAARIDASGGMASLLALGALLLGASGALNVLSRALNHVFRPASTPAGIVAVLRKRLLAIAMLLTLGFLLLVSLVLSAVLNHMASQLQTWLGDIAALADVVNFIVAFAGVCGMTAAILKWLPDREINWRDAVLGGAVAALLFGVGKQLVGIYIGRTGTVTVTVYGAAGSLAVLALWMYFAAQAFLFGAAVAATAADHR